MLEEKMNNIIFKKNGNIFNEKSQALVNPVNCVGVMGAGLAKKFKNMFPDNYKHYRESCLNKSLIIGNVFVFKEKDRIIINLPTKNHWKDNSKLDYISNSVDAMSKVIQEKKITSVALPALGCGLGGLEWKNVKEILINKLNKIDNCRFIIFEPR